MDEEPKSEPLAKQNNGWLHMYVLGSSFLIVILIVILLFRISQVTSATTSNNESEKKDSLQDAKEVTAELQKQRDIQDESIARQKAAEEQRRVEENRNRLAEEARQKAEQQKLALEAKRQAAKTLIAGLQVEIDQLNKSLEGYKTASEELNTNVKNFLLDHKMATAAMAAGLGGGSVIVDKTNHYSDEAKTVGAVGAIAAVLWLANDGDNIKEVINVGSELTKASNKKDQYSKKVSKISSRINDLQSKIRKIGTTIICSNCHKSFLVINDELDGAFDCPYCNTSLKLERPQESSKANTLEPPKPSNIDVRKPASDSLPGEKFSFTRRVRLQPRDLSGMTPANIRYAINEMYARHGLIFGNKDVQNVFQRMSWYRPTPNMTVDTVEKNFSPLEFANMQTLAAKRQSDTAAR